MADTIAKGAVVIGANTAGLESGLKNAQKSISGFQTKITDSISFFSTGPTGAAVAGFKSIVGFIKDIAHATQEAGDRAEKMLNASESFGIPAQTFHELTGALKLAGIEIDTIEKGFKQLSEVVVEAAIGSEDAAKKLSLIGLKPEDLVGLDTLATLEKVFNKINEIPNAMERVRAMSDIFGKSGVKMMPLLNGDYRKEMESLRRAGSSLTEEEMKKLDDLADNWTRAGLAWSGAFDRLIAVTGGDTLPKALGGVAEQFNDALKGKNNSIMDWGLWGGQKIIQTSMALNGQGLLPFITGSQLQFNSNQPPAAAGAGDKPAAKPGVGNTTIQNAIADAQAKLAKDLAKSGQELESQAKTAVDTWGMGTNAVKAYQLELKGLNGAQLEAAKSAATMLDNIELVKGLVQEDPVAMMRKQIAALQQVGLTDAERASGFGALAQGIIGKAGLNSQPRTVSAMVAGSNEDIRARIQSQIDSQAASPVDQVRDAVKELSRKYDQQLQLGRDTYDVLQKIARKEPINVEAR